MHYTHFPSFTHYYLGILGGNTGLMGGYEDWGGFYVQYYLCIFFFFVKTLYKIVHSLLQIDIKNCLNECLIISVSFIQYMFQFQSLTFYLLCLFSVIYSLFFILKMYYYI